MVEFKKFVNELLESGKSDIEVSDAISEGYDSFSSEFKSLDAKEIATEIMILRKNMEIKTAMKNTNEVSYEAPSLTLDSVKACIEDSIESKLDDIKKTISVHSGIYSTPVYNKAYNPSTGKIVDVEPRREESVKALNNLMLAIVTKDFSSARSLSEEIETSNKASLTGIVSDVANRGGYAVPAEYSDMIAQLQYSKQSIVQLCNNDPIIANEKIYPTIAQFDVAELATQSTELPLKTQAFGTETIAMNEIGGYVDIGNKILRQRGVDISNAVAIAAADAFARVTDTLLLTGTTNASINKANGLLFSSKTIKRYGSDTALEIGDISLETLAAMEEALSMYSNGTPVWICNLKVKNVIGRMLDEAGNPLFPGYQNGLNITPQGYKMVVSRLLGSELILSDTSADNRATGGTSDAIILADLSNVIVGQDAVRISSSEDFKFSNNATSIRFIKSFGYGQIQSNFTVAQKLTPTA